MTLSPPPPDHCHSAVASTSSPPLSPQLSKVSAQKEEKEKESLVSARTESEPGQTETAMVVWGHLVEWRLVFSGDGAKTSGGEKSFGVLGDGVSHRSSRLCW